MKSIKQYLVNVMCINCKTSIQRNKYQYKKANYKAFCSQQCTVYYKDPKQSKIMEYIYNSNFYYLIGLIATDGYINYPGTKTKTKSHKCMIKLSQKDKDILYKIQNIFGGSITTERNGNTFCWYISNKKFICYLRDVVGLTNNKTYNLNVTNWFNQLIPKFKESFIRGCYDGDGTIYFAHTDYFRCHSAICTASKEFANLFLTYFKNSCLNVHPKNRINGNIKATTELYYIYLNGKNILQMQNIYKLDEQKDLYIKRKYEAYKFIYKYYSYNTTTLLE
jgi:hypothetical protein